MKLKNLSFRKGFRVHRGNRRSEAAEMVLEPGGAEGGKHEIRNTGRVLCAH